MKFPSSQTVISVNVDQTGLSSLLKQDLRAGPFEGINAKNLSGIRMSKDDVKNRPIYQFCPYIEFES